ncbi:two-component system response regulator YesN [Paenibacillus phyllosphaerae]|uniref:Two-component system response regulator YesN n=1 Tax=Paenibacillus phyllosphaerae TaxID=274593 RepID=A0A7W5AWI6_9BACL|nr:response regulator [Paenibacillus phyllosphaerae]MBB3110090.1 two-component system response regulator YesN [Paenibacillus phyllosphaerae]
MATDPIEILIVDDEPKQRRGLAAMVRMLRPDYRVHEAKNGKEALELAHRKPPDIVFTDIQMPIVNGIEFVEHLHQDGSKLPKVVFVSVYHEFGYAQQAVRLGAKDYLVKPVSPDHLEPILVQLERQISKESMEQSAADSLSQQLAQSKTVYIDHLLYRWMTEELQPAEYSEVQAAFDSSGPGNVIILETWPTAASQDEHEWRQMLKRAVQQTLGPYADAVVLSPEHEKEHMYVIAKWKFGAAEAQGLEKLRNALAQLGQMYNRVIGAGIGAESACLEADIRTCCSTARQALLYLFYYHEGMWLAHSAHAGQLSLADPSATAAKESLPLEEAVTSGNTELALLTLADILERLAAGYGLPFRLKCSVIQLLLACLKRAELVIDDAGYRQLTERIDQEILAARRAKDMKAAAARLLTDIIQQMKKDKGARSEWIMTKCKEYMEEHLHEDIGLDLVAQRFYYNASYFSILFKNHFGVSFTDYLVKTRMQRARHLLLQSDQKVADIAKAVGYKDIKYFNKVFKKMFLHSPDEFRRTFTS